MKKHIRRELEKREVHLLKNRCEFDYGYERKVLAFPKKWTRKMIVEWLKINNFPFERYNHYPIYSS